MKKIVLLLIVIFVNLNALSAQGEDYIFDGAILEDYNFLSNPSVQSPDVTAFQKVTQIPVSNYTGRANISIPIYNIQVGSMNVPISISYNSSGVKVADMPSNVGSNWALNAGGVVTKSVQGLDDYLIPKVIPSPGTNDEYTPAGWLIGLMGYTLSPNQQNDPMPDIYHVNAPGLSTKYIHEGNSATPVEIENNGNIIEETLGQVYSGSVIINGTTIPLPAFGPTSLKTTGINGVQYNFATPEVSLNYYSGNSLNNFLNGISFKANAFKLDSMFDPETNQTINFVYEEYSNHFHDTFYARPGIANYSINVLANRLTHINFDKGSVEFVYNLNRLDNTGEKALTDILIKNHLGETVKHMKFDYSYFQSSINPTTPQSKRLRLDKVYQVDNNGGALVGEYVFTYNTNIEMPPRDSWAHDFLGYNNDSFDASNTSALPKIYRRQIAYDENYTYDNSSNNNYRRVYGPIDNGTSPIQAGNFSLEANEEASKAYILTGIKYPTGGQSEIEYESNEFYYGYSGVIKGGGLRVKSMKLIDEFGIGQIQDYKYINGRISQMPLYTSLASSGLKIYNVPQSSVELTNGSFVGYELVTITNRYNKQYTRYSYYTSSDYPNIPSTKTIFGNDSPNEIASQRAWRAEARYSLNLDRDILRGKLRGKSVVDKDGLYVLKQEFEYELKEFRTINYTFQNPIHDPSRQGCYSEEGLYYRQCGGYDEEISFPIERNLLVSVKTQELEDFHGETDYIQSSSFGNYVETEKRYWYDEELPRLLSKEQGIKLCDREYYENYEHQDWAFGESPCINPDTKYISKTFFYPSSGSILNNQHRLTTPLTTYVKNEKGLLKSESFTYQDYGDNIVNLEKVDFTTTNNNGFGSKTSDIITERDHKGNILEVVSQDGVYTSFIYGYDSRYLICELKNISYSDLTTAATTLNISLSDLSNSNSNTQIKTLTNQLRGHLVQGKITSYTYKPLVGIVSQTDVRGREMNYEYDSYNRLEFIKDHDQNIISKNTYNYKN